MLYPISKAVRTLLQISKTQITVTMGLWHSLTNSFTSYFYPAQSGGRPTEATIRTKALRLILCSKQAQYRLQQATIKEEQELLKILLGNQLTRNRGAQQIRMQQIIRNSQKKLVYDQLIILLTKIIKEARLIETDPSKVSNECIVAINSVLFLYDKMQLHQFVSVKEMFPQTQAQLVVGIEQTSPIIRKYLNEKKTSHYDLNLYACELRNRQGVGLDVFNAVGHQFVPDPQEPIEESPSARMFAITLENVELPEEEEKMEKEKVSNEPLEGKVEARQ